MKNANVKNANRETKKSKRIFNERIGKKYLLKSTLSIEPDEDIFESKIDDDIKIYESYIKYVFFSSIVNSIALLNKEINKDFKITFQALRHHLEMIEYTVRLKEDFQDIDNTDLSIHKFVRDYSIKALSENHDLQGLITYLEKTLANNYQSILLSNVIIDRITDIMQYDFSSLKISLETLDYAFKTINQAISNINKIADHDEQKDLFDAIFQEFNLEDMQITETQIKKINRIFSPSLVKFTTQKKTAKAYETIRKLYPKSERKDFNDS